MQSLNIYFQLRLLWFGCVPLTDMQTLPPLRSGRNFMKGAECAEYNGKNNKKILRFLFFELSSKIVMMTSQKMTL